MKPKHQYSTQTRESKPASQLHSDNKDVTRSPCPYISTVLRREGWSSRPSCTVNTKAQSMKPASGRVWNPRLARFGVGIQNMRLEARVTTEKLCVLIRTILITGSITAHVMSGVNPHYGGFLGESFTPETPINSSVCYWRGVESFWSRFFGWEFVGRKFWSKTRISSWGI